MKYQPQINVLFCQAMKCKITTTPRCLFFFNCFFFLFLADKPDHVSLNVSTNKVCAGTEVLFTCSAGAANPATLYYSLHDKNSAGAVKTSSNQGGVFALTVSMKGQHIYTCEAANSVGTTVSSSSTVEVQGECEATIFNIFHEFAALGDWFITLLTIIIHLEVYLNE